MTEAEKRAEASIAYWLSTLHPEVPDPPSLARAFLTALEEAGLQITTRPQRKPLPDCEGWWLFAWLDAGDLPSRIEYVCVEESRAQPGRLLFYRVNADGYEWVDEQVGRIEWVEGPLEVPT